MAEGDAVNVDELKPGDETDRLVAESVGATKDVAGDWSLNGEKIGTQSMEGDWDFHPSSDLNDAFWAAEQVGLFDDYSLGWRRVYNRWELSKFIPMDGPYKIAHAETPAMAICKAILKLKEPNVRDSKGKADG